ncbi:MAG: GTPase Era, partial [Clostridia bacterium]|nr:GTPase Era [Clostridia bacterium]
GVYNGESYQMVFIDTPGVQTPKNKLGEVMEKSVKQSLIDVDAIILMLDISYALADKEKELYKAIKGKAPVVICINKCDTADEAKILETIDGVAKQYEGAEIIPISAKENKNLDKVISVLEKHLKEGPKYYPDDMITDQPERVIAGEIIREKALNFLFDELPHGIGINVMRIEDEGDRMGVYATIYCEKDSHKGMIIGKHGSMLQKIGKKSREDLQKLFDKRVYLELYVKVVKDWRNKQSVLNDLGF